MTLFVHVNDWCETYADHDRRHRRTIIEEIDGHLIAQIGSFTTRIGDEACAASNVSDELFIFSEDNNKWYLVNCPQKDRQVQCRSVIYR